MEWRTLLSEERIRNFKKGEDKGNDLRSEFEKDYHRIIISASFRRLQDKTQVFPLEKSDFVRTRLTHSLEVSSIGKSLGQSVARKINEVKLDTVSESDISNILACAGLLHDIGNPPFGHFGETSIREWFKSNLQHIMYDVDGTERAISDILDEQMLQDLYNFEGNAQALRLASKLHFIVDENGMNLTFALLNTLIKYPVNSLNVDKESGDIKTKKLGYYYAEEILYNKISEVTQSFGSRYPLTYLLEAADDIAYNTADIEDGFKKGKYSFEILRNEIASLKDTNKLGNILYEKLIYYHDKAVKYKYNNPELYALQNWIIYMQGIFIGAVTNKFVNQYDSIMSGDYKHDLFYSTDAEKVKDILESIAVKYIFKSRSIMQLEISANKIISFFLNNMIKAVLYYDTDKQKCKMDSVDERFLSIISENYKYIYKKYSEKKSEKEKLYLRILLVTDYICGMTDTYAKDLYQDLNGISN